MKLLYSLHLFVLPFAQAERRQLGTGALFGVATYDIEGGISLTSTSQALQAVFAAVNKSFSDMEAVLEALEQGCQGHLASSESRVQDQANAMALLKDQQQQSSARQRELELDLHDIANSEAQTQAAYTSAVAHRATEAQTYADRFLDYVRQQQTLIPALEVMRTTRASLPKPDEGSAIDYIMGVLTEMLHNVHHRKLIDADRYREHDAQLRGLATGAKQSLANFDMHYEDMNRQKCLAEAKVRDTQQEWVLRKIFKDGEDVVHSTLQHLCGGLSGSVRVAIDSGKRALSRLLHKVGETRSIMQEVILMTTTITTTTTTSTTTRTTSTTTTTSSSSTTTSTTTSSTTTSTTTTVSTSTTTTLSTTTTTTTGSTTTTSPTTTSSTTSATSTTTFTTITVTATTTTLTTTVTTVTTTKTTKTITITTTISATSTVKGRLLSAHNERGAHFAAAEAVMGERWKVRKRPPVSSPTSQTAARTTVRSLLRTAQRGQTIKVNAVSLTPLLLSSPFPPAWMHVSPRTVRELCLTLGEAGISCGVGESLPSSHLAALSRTVALRARYDPVMDVATAKADAEQCMEEKGELSARLWATRRDVRPERATKTMAEERIKAIDVEVRGAQ